MRFSLIMPSYLGAYHNAAKNREEKIVRAIESVLHQTFQDFELIVVSDGCDKTVEIVKPYFYEYMPKIRLVKIPKQRTWSGLVRNAGISLAEGEIITYLDIDDYLGENHLQIINDNFGEMDWVWYNHKIWSVKENAFITYHTDINVHGRCGTSSISHKRSMEAYWINHSYSHDLIFINTLKSISKNYGQVPETEYLVCHMPNGTIDV